MGKHSERIKENLYEIAEHIWDEMPTERILALIDSMPRRINAVITAKGGHTKY